MARKLSVKQKNILKQYTDVICTEDLPLETMTALEKINDYETLWQDVNRFLYDNYKGSSYTSFHASSFL